MKGFVCANPTIEAATLTVESLRHCFSAPPLTLEVERLCSLEAALIAERAPSSALRAQPGERST